MTNSNPTDTTTTVSNVATAASRPPEIGRQADIAGRTRDVDPVPASSRARAACSDGGATGVPAAS